MLVGAHLDNVDTPPDSSYRRLGLIRVDVAVTLWTAGTRHRRSVYEDLWRAGVRRLCIRVGDEGIVGGVPDYLTDVDQAVNEAVAAGFPEDAIDVQLLNEPNLRTASPVTVGTFVGAVLHGWRRKARPLLPPVSRGKEGWQDYARAMVGAVGPLPALVGYAVHAYADDCANLPACDPAGVPVVVTEFSHPTLTGRARGEWVVARLREMARKGYGYACQFIVDGVTGGAWPENYRMTDEEALAIGGRAALPEPDQPKEPPPMQIRAIDISNNNGHVDLARVKAAEYEVVIVKISEDDWGDDDFFDSYAAENLANARALGMGVGVYTFLRPSKSSPAESITLIQRALAKLGGLQPGEVVALDVEDEQFTGDLHVWLAEALALGSQVFGFPIWKYSADWYTSTRNLEHEDLALFPTWWASYQDTLPTPQAGWGPIRMWQNGVLAAGAVPGVAGQCDVNVFFGSLPDFKALGKPGAAEPAPTPAPPDPLVVAFGEMQAAMAKLEAAIKARAA